MAKKKQSAKKKAEAKPVAGKAESAPVSSEPTPYHPAMNLRSEIDRVFDRFFGDEQRMGWMRPGGPFGRMWDWSKFPSSMREALTSIETTARSDLSEDDKQYELTVELPGMDEKDLEVTLSDNVLTIKGEKKDEKETREKDYHLTERSYGTVRRQFTLPADVDAEKMTARFAKGVLEIVLPKSAAAQSKVRRIDVSGG